MTRRLPGISATVEESRPAVPDGIFLVRLDHAQHRWHPQKPFYVLRLLILEPSQYARLPIVSRLYCTPKAMWKLGWFLRDFLYDPESLTRDEIDEKAMRGLVGIVKISHRVINGASPGGFRRLCAGQPMAGAVEWLGRHTCCEANFGRGAKEESVVIYSYSQISQYLTCPRRYRHRYLDGWQEKEQRASILFGRAFEQAVAALFRHEDPAAVLFEHWSTYKQLEAVYPARETWDTMLQQGVHLLKRFVQDGRVRIRRPRTQQQIQFNRTLNSGASFVSYVDAIGELDGKTCVLEWKTSSARYAEEPVGITGLDPQLICYSWMTGIDAVAQVVFVRKRAVEVQYLTAVITEKQRNEFQTVVEDTVQGIESGMFLPHSGIRFPQNACTTCPFVGLCLDQRELIETALVRRPGVDLGLFDELGY